MAVMELGMTMPLHITPLGMVKMGLVEHLEWLEEREIQHRDFSEYVLLIMAVLVVLVALVVLVEQMLFQ
jgi:hypothetical protein